MTADWSNWLYFAIGLGVGIGIGWWRSPRQSAAIEASDRPVLTKTEPAAETAIAADSPVLPSIEEIQAQLAWAKLSYQMLCCLSQFKGGFLSRISHELRSPLNSLIGTHQLVLADLCSDRQEELEFLAKANESALKLVQMIDDVLDVSRLEYGKDTLYIESVQVSEIFDKVYYLTRLQAANRNLPFQVVPLETELCLRADRRRLIHMLACLIDAAIAYALEGKLQLQAHFSPDPTSTRGFICLWIDVPQFPEGWSEPVDLLQCAPLSLAEFSKDAITHWEIPRLSPGTMLWIGRSLLEFMGGRLEFAEPPDSPVPITRLQCLLPAATPLAVVP